MKKGFTLIELLIVVAIIAILAAIAVPNFLEAQIRSKVSRVKSDQRSMATALASYYVDNNGYPFAVIGSTPNALRNSLKPTSAAVTPQQPVTVPGNTSATNLGRVTFALPGIVGSGVNQRVEFSSLTTPVSYITSYFRDPFSNRGESTFTYLPDGPGWILVSYGPDADEGSLPANFQSMVRCAVVQFGPATASETPFNGFDLVGSYNRIQFGVDDRPSPGPYALTYDPTNGTTSAGDVWKLAD